MPNFRLARRFFIQSAAASLVAANLDVLASCRPSTRRRSMQPRSKPATQRCIGMLSGSLLGDAMGGPLEFAKPEKRKGLVVGARQWNESKRLDAKAIRRIAGDAKLMGYEKVRPDTAAYGPWIEKAPAGTLTDDSRWKIILIRALREAESEATELSPTHIAKAICNFRPIADQPPRAATQKLLDEGLREYRYAAKWILGERDPKVALPPERLWSGIANCSGQMMLLPLAIKYAGDPESAYLKSFELNCVDSAPAKDIASMIVAGLAAVLSDETDALKPHQRWNTIHRTMRTLDPLRMKQVPFAGRPLDKWLDLVDSIEAKAEQRPAVAYRLLETDAKPVFFWDAHFTFVAALTLLRLCRHDPMCALMMAIDFGHDTDSYAQLIGAFCGAVYGVDAFPKTMRFTVAERLKQDYGEDVTQWVSLLSPKRNGEMK